MRLITGGGIEERVKGCQTAGRTPQGGVYLSVVQQLTLDYVSSVPFSSKASWCLEEDAVGSENGTKPELVMLKYE